MKDAGVTIEQVASGLRTRCWCARTSCANGSRRFCTT